MQCMRTLSTFQRYRGFSLIEVLVVVGIISVLSAIVLASLGDARNEAYYAETQQEMRTFKNALEMYRNDNYYSYPEDQCRSVPPEMSDYLTEEFWPGGSWEESVYDWEAWDTNNNGEIDTYQLSLRCGTCDNKSTECQFLETTEWDNEGSCTVDENSALYYCIQGNCRPHNNHPNTCGKCMNPEQSPGCEAT